MVSCAHLSADTPQRTMMRHAMEANNRRKAYTKLLVIGMLLALALVPVRSGRTQPQSLGVRSSAAGAGGGSRSSLASVRQRIAKPGLQSSRRTGVRQPAERYTLVDGVVAEKVVRQAPRAAPNAFKSQRSRPISSLSITRHLNPISDAHASRRICRCRPKSGAGRRCSIAGSGYSSRPKMLQMPGHPFKRVARDIGFRSMLVFNEPDGTEALYVGGISSRSINPGVPPPRILRSTDGEHFLPVPQRKGTFLGDISANGFRSLTAYNGRLYVIGSEGLLGQGALLEATDPAKGNNNFRQVTPDQMTLFELSTFNGFLYLGSGNRQAPFTVWKTNASGQLPYTFIPVLTHGGYLQPRASNGVVTCMCSATGSTSAPIGQPSSTASIQIIAGI